MAAARRLERLQAQIVREASSILLKGLNDPRIGPCIVTRARLSRDLRYCTLYLDPRGDEAAQRTTLRGLQSALPVLQGRLGEVMGMRFLPKFSVEIDKGLQKFREMEGIFRLIAQERDAKNAQECQNGIDI